MWNLKHFEWQQEMCLCLQNVHSIYVENKNTQPCLCILSSTLETDGGFCSLFFFIYKLFPWWEVVCCFILSPVCTGREEGSDSCMSKQDVQRVGRFWWSQQEAQGALISHTDRRQFQIENRHAASSTTTVRNLFAKWQHWNGCNYGQTKPCCLMQ